AFDDLIEPGLKPALQGIHGRNALQLAAYPAGHQPCGEAGQPAVQAREPISGEGLEQVPVLLQAQQNARHLIVLIWPDTIKLAHESLFCIFSMRALCGGLVGVSIPIVVSLHLPAGWPRRGTMHTLAAIHPPCRKESPCRQVLCHTICRPCLAERRWHERSTRPVQGPAGRRARGLATGLEPVAGPAPADPAQGG